MPMVDAECMIVHTTPVADVSPKRWDNSAEYRRNKDKLKKSGPHLCYFCGKPVDMTIKWPDPMSFATQHIVPRSMGGGHEIENLAASHMRCNAREGNALAGTLRTPGGNAHTPTPGVTTTPRIRLVQSRVWHD